MPDNYIQKKKKPPVSILKNELATRETATYISDFYNTLPNPDPVLRKAGIYIQTLREIRRDTRVSSATRSRKAGLFKRNMEIVANDASDSTVSFIETVLFDNFNLRQVVREILDYWGYGYQVSEIVWGVDGSDIIPVKIQGKPQEWFTFSNNDNYLLFTPQAMKAPEPVENYKFLLTANEADYTNPYGIGAYSDCFWPVTFKKGGMKFWARFIEKYGMPFMSGKLPRSASQPDRDQLLEQLMTMIQNVCAVFPDDSSIELHEADKTSSTEAYEHFNDYHNAEISIAILGHEGTQMSTPGKLGDEDAAMEARADIIDADCENVAETINTLIRWILELNPHRASDSLPTFSIYADEQVDKTLAERDEILSRTGVKFKSHYYKRVYNLSDDDFEISADSSPGSVPGSVQPFGRTALASPEDGSHLASPGQQDPPAAPKLIIERAQDEIHQDSMIDTIREMADKAGSLEEFQAALLDRYIDIEENDGEKIEQALTAAELAGRYDIMDETDLIE